MYPQLRIKKRRNSKANVDRWRRVTRVGTKIREAVNYIRHTDHDEIFLLL